MQHYINQLIEDLEEVAKNPPTPSYFELPDFFEDMQEIAELALVPFKTIEELTGIEQEMFPEMIDLNEDQSVQVNKAIFKVFEALNIELIDVPADIAPEWLYEVITSNWKYEVQYLPTAGMDLEFCTGNPQTCPYGECCDCGDDWDPYELPEKFSPSIIEQLTQLVANDCPCYLNTETLEIENIKNNSSNKKESDALALKLDTWNEYYKFDPVNNDEMLNIMDLFAANMEDESFQEELFFVLGNTDPHSNFESLVLNSDYSEVWFSHFMESVKDKVRLTIYKKLLEKIKPIDDSELPF